MHVGTTFAAINRAGLFDAVDAKIHLQSPYPAVPMTFRPLSFDAETHLADVHMFGQRAFGAVYLIDDERKAIVETGTSWDAERILEAVHAFGLRPQEIDAVVVSHIHLDHAGGAGACVQPGAEPRDVPTASRPQATRPPLQPLRPPHEAGGRDRGDDGGVPGVGPNRPGQARFDRRGRRPPRAVRHELSGRKTLPAGFPRTSDPRKHHRPRGVSRADGACCPHRLRKRSAESRRTGRAVRRSSRASRWTRWHSPSWTRKADRTRRNSPRSPNVFPRRNPRWPSSTTSPTSSLDSFPKDSIRRRSS